MPPPCPDVSRPMDFALEHGGRARQTVVPAKTNTATIRTKHAPIWILQVAGQEGEQLEVDSVARMLRSAIPDETASYAESFDTFANPLVRAGQRVVLDLCAR